MVDLMEHHQRQLIADCSRGAEIYREAPFRCLFWFLLMLVSYAAIIPALTNSTRR
jgi:hypothetical protein